MAYRGTHFLKTAELDQEGRMPLAVLVTLIQQSAEQDAASLGFGVEELLGEGLTWMLLRLRVRLETAAWPAGRQDLTVETWPSACDARFAFREFTFTAGEGPFAHVWSDWLMVDRESGRPVRLKERFTSRHLDPRGVRPLEPFPQIKPEGEPLLLMEFPVRLSDLDVNGHVNNSHYAHWIREAVPGELRFSGMIRSLDLEYRAGARYGETVCAVCHAAGEGQFDHVLRSRDSGELLVRARSRWAGV